MMISDAEERLLRQTRLVRSLEEQVTSLRLDMLKPMLEASPQALEELVGRLQIEYGVRKLAEESGEVAKALKRHLDYGEPIDMSSLEGELGNVLFFVTFLARCAGLSLEGIVSRQVEETEKRFSGGWSIEAASAKKEPQAPQAPSQKTRSWQCQARKNKLFSEHMGLNRSDQECGPEHFLVSNRSSDRDRLFACKACAKPCVFDRQWSVSYAGISDPLWWPKGSNTLDSMLSTIFACRYVESKSEKEEALWKSLDMPWSISLAIKEGPSLSAILMKIFKASPWTFVRVISPAIPHLKSEIRVKPEGHGFREIESNIEEWIQSRSADMAKKVSDAAMMTWDENYDGHSDYDEKSNIVCSFLLEVSRAMTVGSNASLRNVKTDGDPVVYYGCFSILESGVRSIISKHLSDMV